MEPYSKILETIENNGDYASAVAKIQQEINEIPQRIEAANNELVILREEENSYITSLPNFQEILIKAQSHLLALKLDQIVEMRSFNRPPNIVERITTGVMVILGENSLSFEGFRRLSSTNNFLGLLMNLSINNIPKQRIINLKPIIDEFQGNEENIRRSSCAAYELYNWLFGVYQYCHLLSQFRPIGQIRQEINEKSQEIADLQQKMLTGPNRLKELKEMTEKMNNP